MIARFEQRCFIKFAKSLLILKAKQFVRFTNASAYSSHLIQAFLAKRGILVVYQLPFSPDMASCNFRLFPKLKASLKGSCFVSKDEIMQNATSELNNIRKEAFQKCFRHWKEQCARCVEVQGAYFEGD